MKKFFSILMIICLGFVGLLFGCSDDKYANLTISIKTQQARAADGSITLYVGEDSEDITINIAGAPKGFNYVPSFSLSEELVKIGEVNHMHSRGVTKTIQGIAPGFTVLTAYTSEGYKTATLKINVIKKAESISIKSDYKLAVLNTPGYETTIKTLDAISILPKDSNQNTIKYSLVEKPGLGDVVQLTGNKLTVLPGVEMTAMDEFQVKAEVVNHEGVVNTAVDPAIFTVKILDDILPTDIKLYQSKTSTVINETVKGSPIESTIVLSKNFIENNYTNVFVGVQTTENISVIPPANLTSSPVMTTLMNEMTDAGVQYFVYRVQAIRYSTAATINFKIQIDGYEELFNFDASVNVKCELYIKSFSVNDTTLADDALHEVKLYTNDQTSGTRVKISTSDPREILAEDAKFTIKMIEEASGTILEDAAVNQYFIITDVATNSRGLKAEYKKDTTLSIRLNPTGKLTEAASGKYQLVVTAIEPVAYTFKAQATISIVIVKGIEKINSITTVEGGVKYDPSSDINIVNESAAAFDVAVDTTPATPDAYETLYATSSNDGVATIQKLSNDGNTFKITPVSIGFADIRFGSKNLLKTAEITYRVYVYDEVESFFVSADAVSMLTSFGYSELEGKSLKHVVVKTPALDQPSSDILLQISVAPATANKNFYEQTITVVDQDGTELEMKDGKIQDEYFSVDPSRMKMKFLKHRKETRLADNSLEKDYFYMVTVTLSNYGGDPISHTFKVESYIPVNRFDISLSRDVLYNPANLGYFDLNNPTVNYVKTSVLHQITQNATYGEQRDIHYEVVSDGVINNTIFEAAGAEFTLKTNHGITSFPHRVYITSYVIEFGKRISDTVEVIIRDPVTVESMAVDGDLNGDIFYFKLGFDDEKTLTVTLNPSYDLFNNKVRWVQYAEGTTTVLDFDDSGLPAGSGVANKDDAIFSVEKEAGATNRFKVKAIKAGNAKLLLLPEDKIKDFNSSNKNFVYSWSKAIVLYVSIADGSRAYPYHVSTYKDLKDIAADEVAMSKFYVLTADISIEDNWSPLGLDKNLDLTGGINGKYTRIVDATAVDPAKKYYSVQHKITNLSYASPGDSNLRYLGFLYRLRTDPDREDEEIATLENLFVEYSYIQSAFANDFVFGGLVTINQGGTITDCRAKLSQVVIELKGLNNIFGGLVGDNAGDIINTKVDNVVDISADIKLSNPSMLSTYIGGLAGRVSAGLLNGYQKDHSEIDDIQFTFGDQGYDLILDIDITTSEEFLDAVRKLASVGGVIGHIANTDSLAVFVNDYIVRGSIKAPGLNNVGGIVGNVAGVLDKDDNVVVNFFNNTNNAKVHGCNNVGGVVGYSSYASFSHCSAENYKETQTTKRPFVIGSDYVGGFGGFVEYTSFKACYFVSYFTNPEDFTYENLTSQNSDIISEAKTGENKVGGFAGHILLTTEDRLERIAAIGNIFAVSTDRVCVAGLIGSLNNTSSNVQHILARGFVPEGGAVTIGGGAGFASGTVFYSTVNNGDSYIAKGPDSYDTYPTIWAIDPNVNNGLPYLLDDSGKILFAFLPIVIDASIIDNTPTDYSDEAQVEQYKQDGYVYLNDNAVVVYLNELKTGALTADQLAELNTYSLSEFTHLEVSPKTAKTYRLLITSNDTSKVRVDRDKIIVVAEGSARITISSKLNADYRFEFYVVVKYGLNNYGLYESSNLLESTKVVDNIAKPIEVLNGEMYALYEDVSYNRVVDGSKYQLKSVNNAYVRYFIENAEYGINETAYKDHFDINTNWVHEDDVTYSEVNCENLTTILAKKVLEDPVKVVAVPYVTLSFFGNNIRLPYKHLATAFYIDIYNGADNIYFESSLTQIEITQLESFVFSVRMDTDTDKDSITYSIMHDGKLIPKDEESDYGLVVNTASGGLPVIYDENGEVVAMRSTYTISYSETADDVLQDEVFYLTFASGLVNHVTTTLEVRVVPQEIVSADIGLYSSKDDYGTSKDGTDEFIFNGETALLTVEIYPNFSQFDSFHIVYTSSSGYPLTLTQLEYNKPIEEEEPGAEPDPDVKKEDPFRDHSAGTAEYIQGYGIKVRKETGQAPLIGSGIEPGKFSYSYIYYFSLLIGSEVPDLSDYRVELMFYNQNKIVNPVGIGYSFESLSSPYVALSVKDSSLDSCLPIGTSNEINVSTRNFEGEPTWFVTITDKVQGLTEEKVPAGPGFVVDNSCVCGECLSCLNKNYPLLNSLKPINRNGKYYLDLPKDNFNLIGKYINIFGSIEKSEDGETFSHAAVVSVYVTLFTVKGMSIEGISADMLKLQIYTPHSLKVNLDVVYNPEVEYSGGGDANYTIANMVSLLKEAVSKADIWKTIHRDNGEEIELEKNSGIKYNGIFKCVGYGDYYAVYGEEVDSVSQVKATASIGYVDGMPTFRPGEDEEPDPDINYHTKVYSKEFSLVFTYQNDIKNPIPITSEIEFLNMEEGKDYRLINDIELSNYTPLSTKILSFDGNDKTIYITSFSNEMEGSNYGLFDTVGGKTNTQEHTMIYNVNVHYIGTINKTMYTDADGIHYIYSLPEIITPLTVKKELTELNFGGIAGVNDGIITNCEVTGQVRIDTNTSGNDANVTSSITEGYSGGIAGINNGYITTNRVNDLSLKTAGNLGGVAGKNTKVISATYADKLILTNDSSDTQKFFTGGFVCENAEGAKIIESYTQGRPVDKEKAYAGPGIDTKGVAAGFVYTNSGRVEDCYSNIRVVASSFSSGFVFVNTDEATVNRCYSFSKVADNSRAASPFTGIGREGGVVVAYEGSITNCFYLKGQYNSFDYEPAIRLEENDFAKSEKLNTFNIKENTNSAESDTDPVLAEGYTWCFFEDKPRLTQTMIETNSGYDYVGKTKNYTEGSEIFFKFKYESGKWFAYDRLDGYDETKEVVITRKVTIAYAVDPEDDEKLIYFKPIYDTNGNPVTTGAPDFKQLYNYSNDPADYTDNNTYYYLESEYDADSETYNHIMRLNNDNSQYISVTLKSFEETYTEENGILHGQSRASAWFNAEDNKSYYKISSGTFPNNELLSERENSFDPNKAMFVMKMEISSATLKNGSSQTAIDLSVDNEGQCDLTYIPTVEELTKQGLGATSSNRNVNYGGCYSYRELDSIQYHYATRTEVGSKANPYLIYDTVSYNTYFTNKFNSELNINNKREYYRLVADIDFDFKNINTSGRILYGYIEGNGMTLKNVTLTYVSGEQETIAFGIFSQAYNSIVNNLDIEVIEIASSAHTYVGGLVGWARTDAYDMNGSKYLVEKGADEFVRNAATVGTTEYTTTGYKYFTKKQIIDYDAVPSYLRKNYFNNINVYKKNDATLENIGLVLGRNIVGGVIGYMTGDSKANNIVTAVNVNAAYVMTTDVRGKYATYQKATDTDVDKLRTANTFGNLDMTADQWSYYIDRRISYAGIAFGALDCNPPVTGTDDYEGYTVFNIVSKGEFAASGGIVGGLIGLLAKNNIAHNVRVIADKNQTIRGSIYAGGIIGENRGTLTHSSIEYAEDKDNNVKAVVEIRVNETFFNNNASTIAIGGLVGFNNAGKIYASISHIDVRNPKASVAGGAVGRSIAGIYEKVVVSGSVLAQEIIGGFTGTSNTTHVYIGTNGLGLPGQVSVYPADNSSANNPSVEGAVSSLVVDDYTSCVAANNWFLDDYPFLTEKHAKKRVAGGFIGSEALSDNYFINIDGKKSEDDLLQKYITGAMKIYSTFSRCFFTHSLYYGSAGEDITPAYYMPVAYITDFDEVRLFTTRGEGLPYEYMYPFIASNTLNQGNEPNSLTGMTHYEMISGKKTEYKDAAFEVTGSSPKNFTHTYAEELETTSQSGKNFYANRGNRKYGYITTADATQIVYSISGAVEGDEMLSYSYIVKRKEDGSVQSTYFSVTEKYFVYSSFMGTDDFTIDTNNFLLPYSDPNLVMYPKINIKTYASKWSQIPKTSFNKDADGYYLIESGADLATLAQLVNEGVEDEHGLYSESKYRIKDGRTISLTGKDWTPIGNSTARPFKGIFEGLGGTITVASQENQEAEQSGVFGYIDGATIQDLTVEKGYICGKVAGGLVGSAIGSTLSNITNSNTVVATERAGGIVGYTSGTTMINCYNRGKVTINNKTLRNPTIGGIVGLANGNTSISYTPDDLGVFHPDINIGDVVINDEYTSYEANKKATIFIGGFIGELGNSTFTTTDFVYNKGNITVNTTAHDISVGGCIASVYAPGLTFAEDAYYLQKMRNDGNITVNNANDLEGIPEGIFISNSSDSRAAALVKVGGVIGRYYAEQSLLGLLTNNGAIYYETQKTSRSIVSVGGVVGLIESAAQNDDSTAPTQKPTYLKESYNSADVEVVVLGSSNMAALVGGVLGSHKVWAKNTTPVAVKNCYNMGNVSSRGPGIVLSGGIYGASYQSNTNVPSVASNDFKYAIGNDVLGNKCNVTLTHAYISNCYNTGSVTAAANNLVGAGALLGYGVGAKLSELNTDANGRNYYLNGVASYAYASSEVTEPEEGSDEEPQTVYNYATSSAGNFEQRTTNTLKLMYPTPAGGTNVGIEFRESNFWEQRVNTWYPTLKNNYEILVWEDKIDNLSSDGGYTIGTAEQLAYLSVKVNSGELSTKGVKFTLVDNIDLANRYFTPIGTSTYPFMGIFDGNGYSIKNMTISAYSAMTVINKIDGVDTAEKVGALFGYCQGATIKNVGLVSPIIKDVDYASAFAYSFIGSSYMEYCYTDYFEITDPVAIAQISDVSILRKEGLISAVKEVSGFVNTMESSIICKSYVNVPMINQMSEYQVEAGLSNTEKLQRSAYLAGFAVRANASNINNSYIGEGINDKLFTYVTHYNGVEVDNRVNPFITLQDGAAMEPTTEGNITNDHCFNLSSKATKHTILTSGTTTIDPDATPGSIDFGNCLDPTSNDDAIPTSLKLEELGWDVIDIWSYEYSLLGDITTTNNLAATIRGLGQNWYNTECEDLILRNVFGGKITERDESATSEQETTYIYYEITTPEQLAWVARMVNLGKLTGKDAAGRQYVIKLMNDINLLGRTWTPIGTMDYPFACKFDFNGYSISNLVIDTANMAYAGLFGYCQGSIITGGSLNKVYINVDSTSEEFKETNSTNSLYMGMLLGKGHNTEITDMIIEGNIVGYARDNIYVGGLAGSLTFGRTDKTESSEVYVSRIQVTIDKDRANPSQVLIPADYRLNNAFGIDEIITEETLDSALKVNIGGFSLLGHSYVGGVVGYVAGKYTKDYSTEVRLEKVFNETCVVSYGKGENSRTYGGGIAGYATENSSVVTAQNNGSVKTATYGYDYNGGVVGMLAGASQMKNALNKGYFEVSQRASVMSYGGGLVGYLMGGSNVEISANLGTTYRNIDSNKIFAAGVFGYVEKDATGALPRVRTAVYVENNCYKNQSEEYVGYYGDGTFLPVSGTMNVEHVSSMVQEFVDVDMGDNKTEKIALQETFNATGVWTLSGTLEQVSVAYISKYKVIFSDDEVIVYAFRKTSLQYGAIAEEGEVEVTTELIIQKQSGLAATHIVIDGRKYALDHKVTGGGNVTVTPDTTADANCIVIKLPSRNITVGVY